MEDRGKWILTNTIVFGDRLRSASKGATGAGYGNGSGQGYRVKREDQTGTNGQWYWWPFLRCSWTAWLPRVSQLHTSPSAILNPMTAGNLVFECTRIPEWHTTLYDLTRAASNRLFLIVYIFVFPSACVFGLASVQGPLEMSCTSRRLACQRISCCLLDTVGTIPADRSPGYMEYIEAKRHSQAQPAILRA